MKKYFTIFILMFFLLTTSSSLQALNVSPALRILIDIEKSFQKINTIKGNFVKTITRDNETLEIHCKFYYKKSDKIYYSFLKPVTKEIISDGKTLTIFENNKLTKYEISKLSTKEKFDFGLIPGFGIDYIAAIKVELYDFSIKNEKDGIITINAISSKEKIPSIEFYIDKQKSFINKMIFQDEKNSIFSTIEFLEQKKIDNNIFFATKIINTVKKSNKLIISEAVQYNNIKFNTDVSDNIFIRK